MAKLDFESFHIKIDGLAFNLKTQNREKIQKIAKYLASTYHCQTYFREKKKPKIIKLVNLHKPTCSAEFWVGETCFAIWEPEKMGRNADLVLSLFLQCLPCD